MLTKFHDTVPDSKVHGANLGHTWDWQDPGGPHVGHVNFAIWDILSIGHNEMEVNPFYGSTPLVIDREIEPSPFHMWSNQRCTLIQSILALMECRIYHKSIQNTEEKEISNVSIEETYWHRYCCFKFNPGLLESGFRISNHFVKFEIYAEPLCIIFQINTSAWSRCQITFDQTVCSIACWGKPWLN